MKRLALILIVLALTVNSSYPQKKAYTIEDLEHLVAEENYATLYKLANERINGLLRKGNPDTLAYYVDYLGTATKEEKGFAQSQREIRSLLEKAKKSFPYSPQLPTVYLAAADFFSKEGEYGLAYEQMVQLLSYFKGKEQIISERLASIHSSLGTFAMRLGNYTVSSEHYRKSLQYFKSDDPIELFILYNSMGIVMWNASKVDSALYYMQKAIAVLDKADSTPINKYQRRAMMQGNISNVYWELGKAKESVKNAELSIQNYKRYSLYGENTKEKDKGLKGYYMSIFNLASSYQEMGNLTRALDLLTLSYQDKLKLLGDDHPEVYKPLVRIAAIYYKQREYAKAMRTLKKVVRYWGEQEPSIWLAQSTAYIAYTYEELNKINEATDYYDKADSLYHFIQDGEYSLEYLTFLTKRAFFHAKNGQAAKAIELGKESVTYAIENQGEESLIAISQLSDMANIYLQLGRYKQAIDYSNRALKATDAMLAKGTGFMDSLSIELKKPTAILCKTKAEYYQLLRKDTSIIKTILVQLTDAVEIIEHRKAILSDQTDLNVLNSNTKDLTDFIKHLNYELYKLSSNKSYMDKIIDVHERALYSRIRSRMERQKAIRFAHLPDSVAAREDLLKTQMETALKSNSGGDNALAYLQAVKNWEAFQQQLKSNYPHYYKMRYGSSEVSLSKLCGYIPEGIHVVRYIFSNEELLAIVATKEKQVLVPLSSQNLKEKILALNDAVNDPEQTGKLAASLYHQLWKPLETHIAGSRVMIIPDDMLYNLSFEMLTPEATTDFATLSKNCLLNKYAISYQYSLLALAVEKRDAAMKGNFIAFAPGFSEKNKKQYLLSAKNDSLHLDKKYLSLLPLPFTAHLVKKLTDKLGGKSFSDNASTPEVFREEAGNHHIIHIGTHAENNNDHPEYSRLIFAKDGKNATTENSVYLYDIYDCDLTSDLAVLTACESGKPGYQDGEGMVSMAHAFNYAGSESIMTGLWKIDEQSSMQITEAFYENLQQGMTKDEALQQAKLHYLKTTKGRMLAPQYWAGLVIMGDVSAVKLEPAILLKWIIGSCIIAVLLAGYYFLRKKKRAYTD